MENLNDNVVDKGNNNFRTDCGHPFFNDVKKLESTTENINSPIVQINQKTEVPQSENKPVNINKSTVENLNPPLEKREVHVTENSMPDHKQAIIEKTMNQVYQSEENQKQNNITDEELLKVFIGSHYDKITIHSFNAFGFLFSTLYMFYRKMFLYALLLFFVEIIIVNIIPAYFLIPILNIFIGLFINKIYAFYAHKKIAKIRKNSVTGNIDEIKQRCIELGGVSIRSLVAGILIEMIVMLVIIVIRSLPGFNSPAIAPLLKKEPTVKTDITYSGTISYDTSIDMKKEFIINRPENFIDKSAEYDYNYEYLANEGIFNKCSVFLTAIEKYNSASYLLNQMAIYNDNKKPAKVAKISVNKIDWYTFSYQDDFGLTYYYGTTKNNRVYLLTYQIQKESPSDCIKYKEEIINSIQSK